jgi:hypothetical protein
MNDYPRQNPAYRLTYFFIPLGVYLRAANRLDHLEKQKIITRI